MKKGLAACVLVFIVYQGYGWSVLYKSSVLELSGWAIIVEPVSESLGSYPIVIGQSPVAFGFLKFKGEELRSAISEGEFSMAAILSMHLSAPNDPDLLTRTIKMANILVNNGFNATWCEADGNTTYISLKKIQGLNKNIELFLDEAGSDRNACINRG